MYISYNNLALDQDNNFHPISLSILITRLPDYVWIYREKLHVYHFRELIMKELSIRLR